MPSDLGMGLFQGGCPTQGPWLRRRGFSLLVLCAIEHQPPSHRFPGLRVMRIPLDDVSEPLSPTAAASVMTMASVVADALRRHKKVLVTCQMGLNRSGLVNGVALRMLTGAQGEEVVEHIRRRRGGMALSNREFAKFVRSLRPAKR